MSWEEVGNDFLYIFFVFDVGCYFKLVCVLGNVEKISSIIFEVIIFVIVVVGLGICFFDVRYMYIKKKIVDFSIFRVVLYNILVEVYFKEEFV